MRRRRTSLLVLSEPDQDTRTNRLTRKQARIQAPQACPFSDHNLPVSHSVQIHLSAMGVTRLVLLLFLALGTVISTPSADTVQSQIEVNKSNATALRTIPAPPWVDAPEFRGTTAILWSCLATLIACVYTAIHLNIPDAGAGQLLRKKMSWVFLTILAPEISLHSASTQYFAARRFLTALRRLQKESDAAPKDVCVSLCRPKYCACTLGAFHVVGYATNSHAV